MNKPTCLAVAAFLALAVHAPAQVSVDVTLEQEQLLPGEAIQVIIKISNRSGETLHFGYLPEWLKVTVEGEGGFSVEKSNQLPPGSPFDLESLRIATTRVNLSPTIQLTRPGRYKVHAEVSIPGWKDPLQSQPKAFDVISGHTVAEQEFGVPGTGNPPEVRKYILQQANYLKQLLLYVRVSMTDQDKLPVVLPIGQTVSFGHPSHCLDKHNNLHVLFQNGARTFRYCAVTPDGKLKLRQSYSIEESRPKLVVADDGEVLIKGGTRQRGADDFPPETEPEQPAREPALPAQPAPPTNATPPPPSS